MRFEMRFRGREIAHPEVGKEKFDQIKKALAEEAKIERDLERKGRMITMVIGPR